MRHHDRVFGRAKLGRSLHVFVLRLFVGKVHFLFQQLLRLVGVRLSLDLVDAVELNEVDVGGPRVLVLDLYVDRLIFDVQSQLDPFGGPEIDGTLALFLMVGVVLSFDQIRQLHLVVQRDAGGLDLGVFGHLGLSDDGNSPDFAKACRCFIFRPLATLMTAGAVLN